MHGWNSKYIQTIVNLSPKKCTRNLEKVDIK